MGTFENATQAFYGVVSDLVTATHLENSEADAARLKQNNREHLNYSFELTSMLDRLTPNLSLGVAAARFIWMMAANNRLADIAFYEPRVAAFTDDGLTVPGSSYGMRLRQPQPGLDQIKGVIDRLRSDPNTRRAAISIYHPIDAVRDSADIPCAFGMFFHNRGGALNCTIVMRSNNAWALLPFNIFEFTMLAEVVAVESGLALGKVSYYAGSMHLYDRDYQKARDALDKKGSAPARMTAMPTDESPLKALTELGKFDADLRHASAGIDARSVGEWTDRIRRDFSPYWAQFGLMLLTLVASKKDQATLDQVLSLCDKLFRPLLAGTSTPTAKSSEEIGTLFNYGSEKVVVLARTPLATEFDKRAQEYEAKNGPIGARRLLEAQRQILDRMAARGESDALSEETFLKVLRGIE